MKSSTLAALAALSVLSVSSAFAANDPNKVIYGNDDRRDIYQVSDSAQLHWADATVALFKGYSVNLDSSGAVAQLSLNSYGGEMGLCTDEPFYEQQTGAFCSGSLVGDDLIITAGHCVTSQDDCDSVKFVFGFDVKQAGVESNNVPANEVYGCSQIVGRTQIGTGADFAVVRLDRKVTNHTPLKINRSGHIKNGTELVMIGHPSGLPTKIAGGAKVRRANNGFLGIFGKKDFFVANTDSYGGNSGSAVINAKTGLIEGILVRGEQDFRERAGAGCVESNRCSDTGCRGEDVTKIAALKNLIP